MKSRRWLVVRVGVKISIKNSIKHSTDLLLSTDLLKFDSAVLQNSQGPTAKQFLEEYAIPVICIENLQPAQSGKLLQSHTLMERCRGELLRRGRRKKKRNGTFSRLSEQPTALVLRTRRRGHPVSEEREREREKRVGKRNRARLKNRNGASIDWEKWKRWWEVKRGEWSKIRCVLIWYPTICASTHGHDTGDVIELLAKLKSPAHVWLKQRTGKWWRAERYWTMGCFHHATREGSVTLRAEFTRMIQHQLIIPHPPLPPSLFARLEAESSGNHSPRTCDTF